MSFLPQEIIRCKRDGGVLDAATLERFVHGLVDGRVSEGQAAAFAMAIFFRGLTLDERVALTRAMSQSGEILDWTPLGLPGPVLDKHSTGGVGDKVSLVLAPWVAACGGFVPMIAGRGLGHTGGTVDKCESIPGYRTRPDRDHLHRVVRDAGCAIVGASDSIAPADRRLYAVRDVTATVESLDLITASILSKKLAAGLHGLVMDVKLGTGAFLPSRSEAERLAESLVTVANGAGLRTIACLTDMNQVLGRSAGNALEVRECIAWLRGDGPADPRLQEITRTLASEMLVLGGLAATPDDARTRLDAVFTSGAVAECFARMVAGLGGPADLLQAPDRYLPRAPVQRPVLSGRRGYIAAIDVRALGLAVVTLGGGRAHADDTIDPAVGLAEVVGLGAHVEPDRPLAVIRARTAAAAECAAATVRQAFTLADLPPATLPPLLAGRITI